MDTLVYASQIVTCAPGDRPRKGADMGQVGLIHDACLAIHNGRVTWVGTRAQSAALQARETVEYPGRCIVPGLVDPHTHPAYAGSRVDEFRMRAQGRSYQDIMASGGGILSTVRATRAASAEDIRVRTRAALLRMFRHGTTTAEAKSGYSLDVEGEMRDLKAIQEAAEGLPMEVVSTFLGAHAVPPEYKDRRADYVDLIIKEALPRIAQQRLAEFCDVFCEEGAFTLEESRRILEAARAHNLGLKIHAEEFAYLGGARMAAALKAASADHLLSLPASDFAALRDSGTVAVLLPGTTLFLGKERYAPARAMIDGGVSVAIGTDFNAGSCMSESMPAALSLGVLQMKLTPEEALLAGTVNAAHAIGRGRICGSLEPDKRADFLVLEIHDYHEWLYHFGTDLVSEIWTRGVRRQKDQPC